MPTPEATVKTVQWKPMRATLLDQDVAWASIGGSCTLKVKGLLYHFTGFPAMGGDLNTPTVPRIIIEDLYSATSLCIALPSNSGHIPESLGNVIPGAPLKAFRSKV